MKRNKRSSVLKSSSSASQKLHSLSETKSTTVAAPAGFDLPDQCWELVFKFLMQHEEDNNHLKSLSVVSKYFLSITNRLRFSLTIKYQTRPFLPYIFRRFPNLTTLNLMYCDLDNLLIQISAFSLNITSLRLSYQSIIPANGLRAFSKNITTLTSLTCNFVGPLRSTDMFLIADCFPNLQLLDLNHCYNIPKEGIVHVLRRCRNIRHLNLVHCSGVKLNGMNFEGPKLEVLNLSYTDVDDQTLYVITKNCCGLLQLLLESCNYITKKGVMHVVENCTQLREINLRSCIDIFSDVVPSMLSSCPSLRKIIVPYRCLYTDIEMKFFLRQGCLIC